MSIPKHAKLMSSNHLSSKFGEGVILEPIRTSNEAGAGGGCHCGTTCQLCAATVSKCGSTGCGSSNKIKVYQ